MDIQQQMMLDLGSGRRHMITSTDPARDRIQRADRLVTKQELESRRAINQQGTSAASKAADQSNAEKLAAWNAPPKGWGDDTDLEDLPNILDGQAHRARLNRESGMDQQSDIIGNIGSMRMNIGGQTSGDARSFLPSARGPALEPSGGRSLSISHPRGGPFNNPGQPTYGDPKYRPLDPAADKDKAPQYTAKQKAARKGNKTKIDVKLPAHTPRAPRAGPHSTTMNAASRNKTNTTSLTPSPQTGNTPTKRPPPSTFNRDKLADSSTFLLAANIMKQNNADFQKHVATSRQAEPGSKAAKVAAKKKEAVVGAPAASPPTLGGHKITYQPGTLESLSTGSDEKVKPKDEGTDGLLSPKTLSSKIWSGSESTGSQQVGRAPTSDTGKLPVSTTRSDVPSKPVLAEEAQEVVKGSNVSEPAASTSGSLVDIQEPTPLPPEVTREKSPAAEDIMDQENVEVAVQPPLTPVSPQLDQIIELGNRILYKGNWYVLEGSKESQQTSHLSAPHESTRQSPDSAGRRVYVSKAVSIPRSLIGDNELVRGALGRATKDESGSLAASKWKPDTARSPVKSESKARGSSISSVARTMTLNSEDRITMLQKARQPPQSPKLPQPTTFQPALQASIPGIAPSMSDDPSSSAVDELSSQLAELKVSRRTRAPSRPQSNVAKDGRVGNAPLVASGPENKPPQSHQTELEMTYESSSTGYGIPSRLESRYRRKAQDYHLDSDSISTKTGGATFTSGRNEPVVVESRWAPAPSEDLPMPDAEAPLTKRTGNSNLWGRSAGGSLEESRWASKSRSGASARK